ncbi:MAG: monovalent cation:proton antiporter-2 (CPA2) family protein [bacterium]
MDTGYLFNVFIFLAAACLVVPLASRFRLGAVPGYIIAGILIGPFGFGWIGDPQRVMRFAEFGVVMMLFVIGLELDAERLWRMRKSILGLGSLQVILTAAAFAALGVSLGYGWRLSLAVGLALSLSSTALVLRMLQDKNLLQTALGETSFSVLLFQDLAVIPMLVGIPLLAPRGIDPETPSHSGAFGHLPAGLQALMVAAVILLVILAGRYLSPHLFRLIAKARLREVFTANSLALVVGITLLMQAIGVSPALGAFLAGVVLAGSEYRRTLEADIEPFKGLLLGLFFISVGMGMDLGAFLHSPLKLLAGLAILMGLKALLFFALGRLFGLYGMQTSYFALSLCQGGEFAFVLFQFAGGLHIVSPEQVKFLTLLVALSMAFTPLLMQLYGRFIVPRYMSLLPEREFDAVDERNPVIIAGFGRFGQVVGRFLLAQGVPVTLLENDPDQIDLIRKFGFKGHFGDATRSELLRSAGAEQARLLVVAVDDADDGLEIVRMAKQEFPQLKIFARARNRRHAYELHKAGADAFKRETFDSSLALGEEIMIFLGKDEAEVRRKGRQFLKHDEATLKESFQFFENEPELINFARLRREELNQILQADVKEGQG